MKIMMVVVVKMMNSKKKLRRMPLHHLAAVPAVAEYLNMLAGV